MTTSRRNKPSSSGHPIPGLYGWHSVVHALRNPHRRWHKLWVAPEPWERLQHQVPSLQDVPHKVYVVPISDLDAKLGRDVVHQGVYLEAQPLEAFSIEDLTPFQPDGRASLVVALDQVEDPQNLGTIIRTSATFRAQGIVMTERHAPPLSPTVLKAASGGVEHVPLFVIPNLVRALDYLKTQGFWVIGLAEEGEQFLHALTLDHPSIIVMGSEGSGLRHLTKQTCDYLVRLPTNPQFPTLNVSAALAASLHEWTRKNPLS